MLSRTGVAHYGRRCSWAHSEGHIGVAHYGILVGGPLQLRWQPIGRRCLWAHLGEVPTKRSFKPPLIKKSCSGSKDRGKINGSLLEIGTLSFTVQCHQSGTEARELRP